MHPNIDKFKVGDFIYFINHESDLYIMKVLEITDEYVITERLIPGLMEGDVSLITEYSHQSMGMISGKTIPESEIPFLRTLFEK